MGENPVISVCELCKAFSQRLGDDSVRVLEGELPFFGGELFRTLQLNFCKLRENVFVDL